MKFLKSLFFNNKAPNFLIFFGFAAIIFILLSGIQEEGNTRQIEKVLISHGLITEEQALKALEKRKNK